MKYLFLLIIFLSCKSDQKKVIVTNTNNDKTVQIPVKHDSSFIDQHDPYVTGKDTAQLNKVTDIINKFPEVKYINAQIEKTSKEKHGISFIVRDEFSGDTSYYAFQVGDNSQEDRYVNIYDFLFEKKTGQIKVYDHLSGSIMSLQDWRKGRK